MKYISIGILICTTISLTLSRPTYSKDDSNQSMKHQAVVPIDVLLATTASPLASKTRPKRQVSHFGNYLFVPDYYDYNQPRPIRGTGSKTTKLPHYSAWDLTRK